MSDKYAIGCVGKLRYEVLSPMRKEELRRVVMHLLTVCEDFDPSDFGHVGCVFPVQATSAQDAGEGESTTPGNRETAY